MQDDEMVPLTIRLGVKQKVVDKLMEEVDGVEEAINLYNISEINDYLSVKIKVISKKREIKSVVCFIIDTEKKYIKEINVYSTYLREINDFDVKNNYTEFLKLLNYYKTNTNYDEKKDSDFLLAYFVENLNSDDIEEIVNNFEMNENFIMELIRNYMNSFFGDWVELELDLEELIEIEKQKPTDNTLVELALEVDAIFGKEVKNLTVGDKVFIKIIDETDYGKFVIEKLEAKDESSLIAMEAELFDIVEVSKKNLKSTEYMLLIRILENIYGRVRISGEVKVKNIEVKKIDKEDKLKLNSEEEDYEMYTRKDGVYTNKLFVILVTLIVLLMLSLLFFLFQKV